MGFKLFWVAVGGAAGAVLRYSVAGAVQARMATLFPWGTLAVNLTGCFLAGFLWQATGQSLLSPQAKVFVFIGVLGAFTTFSTFMLETLHLLTDGEIVRALANLTVHNCAGLLLVWAGVVLARGCAALVR